MAKGNLTHKHVTTKKRIDRRSFLKKGTALLSWITLMNWGLFPFKGAGASMPGGNAVNNQKKLIFIAIDALHPNYFELDAKGLSGGSEGNLLMPNIHAFLKSRYGKEMPRPIYLQPQT